jgi:ubiquinone/menaquinone biosynthesis C-methylase UbiE
MSTRISSLKKLNLNNHNDILLCGIGSGLDIPHLPAGPAYYGIDLTPAMLKRAEKRASSSNININLQQGDVMNLPYANNTFDGVIMHLILAVVPSPEKALKEVQRVLKPGGFVLVLDKFLKPNQYALIRRMLNPITRRIATRLDVVLEHVLAECTELELLENSATDLNPWFRHIILKKKGTP